MADSIASPELSERIDVVTALHACNTATDHAIRFALVPCCLAERFNELLQTFGLEDLRERFLAPI